jgi:hypothetical protein
MGTNERHREDRDREKERKEKREGGMMMTSQILSFAFPFLLSRD